MVRDWDLDLAEPISMEARLVADLGFGSVDLMQLVVAIEKEFGVRGLPFEQLLMREGRYVNEIYLKELVGFLSTHLPPVRTD
jgi:acyl carrier protein